MNRRLLCFRLPLFRVLAAFALLAPAFAQGANRAAWMREARWGVMTHYLHDWIMRGARDQMTVENWNKLSITPHEDYIAGEIDKPDLWTPKRIADGLVDGGQVHVLSYLGATWGQDAPRFTAGQAVAFSKKVAAAGGVITWDTPIQKGGTFAPEFVVQLQAVGAAFAAAGKP